MLSQLHIKGLAIIDELTIEFTDRFNVITGETGAGKSILIKALNLLLGAKVSSDVVRKGCSQATITGTFSTLKTHPVASVLETLGAPAEEESGNLIIIMRRSITSKGRSLAWVNDVPVTLASLRDVAISLIDIFGQHENTRLLDVHKHTDYLDQFLTQRNLREDVRRSYRDLMSLVAEIRALFARIEEQRKNQDFLAFRFEALEKFDPSAEDFEEVQAICRRAGSAMELSQQLSEAQKIVDQGLNGDSISTAIWTVSQIVEKLERSSPGLGEIAKFAAEIASQIDDLSFALGKSLSTLEIDEEDLEARQARLAEYQSLFRKMGVRTIDGLLAERDRLAEEMTVLRNSSERISELLGSISGLAQAHQRQACALKEARQVAVRIVKQRVEAEFTDLGMPGAKFDVELHPTSGLVPEFDAEVLSDDDRESWAEVADILSESSEVGTERANFMLSANPGEPSLPLQKVASGGEVSRIMLALKKALAAGANTCILVFDEIDTGISGRIATMVGKKMRELSKNFQVVCISHLPQVAAFADAHFLVHKFGRNDRTESTITRLSEKEGIEEIARLLSGDSINRTSIANAKSLIAKAAELSEAL